MKFLWWNPVLFWYQNCNSNKAKIYCNIFAPKNSYCLGYQDSNRLLHSLHKLWRVSSPTQQNLSILRLFYSHKMSPKILSSRFSGSVKPGTDYIKSLTLVGCVACAPERKISKSRNLLLCFVERKMNLLQVFQGRCMYFCRRASECCV